MFESRSGPKTEYSVHLYNAEGQYAGAVVKGLEYPGGMHITSDGLLAVAHAVNVVLYRPKGSSSTNEEPTAADSTVSLMEESSSGNTSTQPEYMPILTNDENSAKEENGNNLHIEEKIVNGEICEGNDDDAESEDHFDMQESTSHKDNDVLHAGEDTHEDAELSDNPSTKDVTIEDKEKNANDAETLDTLPVDNSSDSSHQFEGPDQGIVCPGDEKLPRPSKSVRNGNENNNDQ